MRLKRVKKKNAWIIFAHIFTHLFVRKFKYFSSKKFQLKKRIWTDLLLLSDKHGKNVNG